MIKPGKMQSHTIGVSYSTVPCPILLVIPHVRLSIIGLTRPLFKSHDLSKWEADASLTRPSLLVVKPFIVYVSSMKRKQYDVPHRHVI